MIRFLEFGDRLNESVMMQHQQDSGFIHSLTQDKDEILFDSLKFKDKDPAYCPHSLFLKSCGVQITTVKPLQMYFRFHC